MKRFEVQWTRVAQDYLGRIVAYIAVRSPLNAARVLDRIEALGRALEHMPSTGHQVPELVRLGLTGWLEKSSPPWRLIYRVIGRQVFVVAVVDGRRRLDDLLFERLTAVDDD